MVSFKLHMLLYCQVFSKKLPDTAHPIYKEVSILKFGDLIYLQNSFYKAIPEFKSSNVDEFQIRICFLLSLLQH